jgi:hypothetical protein
MSMRVASILASMVLAACSFNPNGGGASPGIDTGVIDAPGPDSAIDSSTDSSIDGPVDAALDACVEVCVGNVIESCGAPIETCALGCSTVGTVHCKQLLASNGVTEADDLGGVDTDMVLMESRLYIFNTDTGEIRHFPLNGSGGGTAVRPANTPGLDPTSKTRFRVMSQAVPANSAPAPDVAIFGMKNLTVPTTSVLRAVGGRALVLATRGAITVAGEIDVGGGRVQNAQGVASQSIAGPGGGRGAVDANPANIAQGCAPGNNGTRPNPPNNRDTGGGGGGFGTAGGKGGPASQTVDGGGAAVAAGMLATACAQTNLIPLRGGSGGAAGFGGNRGGGGGGGLQLTSFASIMINGGTLYAGGAGGDGSGGPDGGGAGGAGGAILLEAPAIALTAGSVTATGGGGGAGVTDTNAGENGQRDGTAAQPTGNGGRGATGANGGAGEVLAADGTGDLDGTGGGGGGAGVIHFRSISAPAVSGGPIIRPSQGTSTAMTTQ